jgi:Tfp pilus assembly protein PilO
MNFSKLSKEKKQHLAGVIALTIAILAALGYFVIQAGYQRLGNLAQKKKAAQEKLEQMQTTVKRSHEVESVFTETQRLLAERESGMASGDLYSWMHSTLRKFQRNYKVEIPQINPVSAPTDVTLIPKFPYKQASLPVAGTAYYHDLGRFIADFENVFPLMRIVNLSLDLNPTPTASERDKLSFRMEIVTLVKP